MNMMISGLRRTPLHMVVDKGNDKVVQILVDAGSDLNVKDNDGYFVSGEILSKSELDDFGIEEDTTSLGC